MASSSSGQPPPEVVQPPAITTNPITYANLFKPSNLNPKSLSAVGNPCGDKIPPIPMKPITYLHGEPTIQFDITEVETMIAQQELEYAVVGKFSYGWPEISVLRTSIPKQCELKGAVKIGLLCNRHILLRCSLFEDYMALMARPMFYVKDKNQYYAMRTFKWDPCFTVEEETSIAMAWISFPTLPPNYYGESQLFSLAAAAGKPLMTDLATKKKSRPSCARVKVEIDLLKEHPSRVLIQVKNGGKTKSQWIPIKYDFLPKYCRTCKLQGHDENGCWTIHPELLNEGEKGKGNATGEEGNSGDGKGDKGKAKVDGGKEKTTHANPNTTNPKPTNPNPKYHNSKQAKNYNTWQVAHNRHRQPAKQNQNPHKNSPKTIENPNQNGGMAAETTSAAINPNTTQNPNPTRTQDPTPQNPVINIITQNPYAALELENNERVQEEGVMVTNQAEDVVTNAPVVTTKQWVANSFEENNVPMNQECADIPSNNSLEKIIWSEDVEEVMEEGEILISEESTNSSSPDDPGEKEEGKEIHMAITIIPEESADQNEPQLENNIVEEAPQASIAAEIGAEATQNQGHEPEVNLNAAKDQPTASFGLPTVREEEISSKQKSVSLQVQKSIHVVQLGVVLVQCTQSLAGKTIHKDTTIFFLSSYDSQDLLQHQLFGGSSGYINWWKSERDRLRGPHVHSNRGIHTERWESEGSRLGGPSLSSWGEPKGIRLGGPHIYWLSLEEVRSRGSHAGHHWWEFEVFTLGGPHSCWRTSEGHRLRGAHAVHWWESKVVRLGEPRIHWVTSESHRIRGLHADYWWESEGPRLGGPLTVIGGWTLRLPGLEDHHFDRYGNPRVADLEDHRHRFILIYTGSSHFYSYTLFIILITLIRHHITMEIPRQTWYRVTTYSELLLVGNRHKECTERDLVEWYRNHLLMHYQCVVLVPRCAQSADNVTIIGDGIRIRDRQDKLHPAIMLYMSLHRFREIPPTFAERQQTHDTLQIERCSLGELPPTFAYRRHTHDRPQLELIFGS
ncbi:hypothetical protein RND71_042013 [Anisodus tanguticus]|uniref:DUF4283 domain-containing protein n=1 Tax=Anisodus tanguticus TaxID=243964 RepID=A0AAE1URU4_9SOLA|nr:hypothetical protein RND71_042013 [Anisodus tanguticus]